MNDRLRIGDAERETAAHELGEHFALGRITADEHAERLEQIWAARTSADLAPVFRDLPRAQQERSRPARPERAPRPGRGRRPALPRVPFPLKVLLAIVVVWWGVHHVLFLLLAAIVYVVFLRPFVHRRRHGRWGHGRYQAGWH